jgi:hypothetical protein
MAQMTAAQRRAVNAPLIANLCTTDMRRMEGEINAGGWPRPG